MLIGGPSLAGRRCQSRSLTRLFGTQALHTENWVWTDARCQRSGHSYWVQCKQMTIEILSGQLFFTKAGRSRLSVCCIDELNTPPPVTDFRATLANTGACQHLLRRPQGHKGWPGGRLDVFNWCCRLNVAGCDGRCDLRWAGRVIASAGQTMP